MLNVITVYILYLKMMTFRIEMFAEIAITEEFLILRRFIVFWRGILLM